MASLSPHPSRKDCRRYRLQFFLQMHGAGKHRKQKYVKTASEAHTVKLQLENLEQASRNGMASTKDIEYWIAREYLSQEEAARCFPEWSNVLELRDRAGRYETDYDRIEDGVNEWSCRNSKEGSGGKTHSSRMSYMRALREWLEHDFTDIRTLTSLAIESHLESLHADHGKALLTVKHTFSHLRRFLSEAQDLKMLGDSPAEAVRLPKRITRAKPQSVRYVLELDEIDHLKQGCRLNSGLIGGAIHIVVYLGLYAGLRNNEMCWLQPEDHIDFDRGLIEVGPSVCEVTSQTHMPKDYEARTIDIKDELIDAIREWIGSQRYKPPFLLPSRKYRQPLHGDSLSPAFGKLVNRIGMPKKVTLYSLRHTHATWCLRSGMDTETLRERLGHEDLKTTQGYLRGVRVENHPSSVLPY